MPTATLDETTVDAAAMTKPVKVFRARGGLSVSVFSNSAKNGGEFYTAVLQRTYKVGDEFKHSSNFLRDQLPVARYLLQQAWEFILDAETSRKSDDAE